MNYLEHTPQDLLLALTGDIMVVERSGSSVNYYTSSSNPQGIFTVTYADAAAAQAAVDAFLLAANPPAPISPIDVGDIVTVISTLGQRVKNARYKVEVVKSSIPGELPYWVLSRNTRLWLFDTDVIFRLEEKA